MKDIDLAIRLRLSDINDDLESFFFHHGWQCPRVDEKLGEIEDSLNSAGLSHGRWAESLIPASNTVRETLGSGTMVLKRYLSGGVGSSKCLNAQPVSNAGLVVRILLL